MEKLQGEKNVEETNGRKRDGRCRQEVGAVASGRAPGG